MEKINELILDNIYLFCLLMIIVFIIIILIICLMKNSRAKRLEKKEAEKIDVDDTLKSKEELESITDEEIEKRIMENYLEEEKETEEEFENSDIENILEELKNASAPTPSEALKKFEEEQEEQAIISYQQLVDSVKNNKINIKDDEEEYAYDDLMTTEDVLAKIEMLNEEIDEEPIKTTTKYEKKDYSYKPNEFISPVFGRMDSSNVLYRQGLEYTDKKPREKIRNINTETEVLTSSYDTKPIREEKNYSNKKIEAEEFLKNLKDFRNKL